MVYKISIESKHESKAKLWRRKTKKILLGSPYEVTLKMKNVGDEDFPGGMAKINIRYPGSIIFHTNKLSVPEIKKGETTEFKIKRSALGKGYASFFGEVFDDHHKPVQIIAHGQELPKDASFYDIFIESRTDVYSYYMLIIGVISLVSLVILSVIQLIR